MSKWICVVLAIGCTAHVCPGAGALQKPLTPRFEENAGQVSSDIRFVVRAPGYAAVFNDEGVLFFDSTETGAGHREYVQMQLRNAAPQSTVSGDAAPDNSAVIYGGAAGSAGTRIRSYTAIRYRSVYPGIDWVWHFREGALEFQFEVSPGADAGRIELSVAGAETLRLDREGNLDIEGSVGLHYRHPEAWQNGGAGPVRVPVAFRVVSDRVAFEVGPHDDSLGLTIDPVVRYSRQLGGAGYDAAYAVVTDSAGNVYVAGETSSVDFTSSKGVLYRRNAFVSKMSPDGAQVLYTVMFSSSGNNVSKAIAMDGAGNIWVAGVAGGSGFPVTTGALSTRPLGGDDAFIARINSGGALMYASYLGGGGTDVATGLAIDASGAVYVAGYTFSVDFPTTSGAAQAGFRGGSDAFLVKLGAGYVSLAYSTLLGGSGNDSANAVSVDGAGGACIAGRTDSVNLPTHNAVQPVYAGSGDALLACLNAAGTIWNVVTYIGGSGPDQANAITRDQAGNIYVAGESFSLYSGSATYDAFVVKLTATGTANVFTIFLGGAGSDSATAIAADTSSIWLAGYTASIDFPIDAPPRFGGVFDGFLAQISPDGKSLLSARYFGGSGDDRCLAMALSATGEPVLAGLTASADFPGAAATSAAPYNAYVIRWQADPRPANMVSPVPGGTLSGSTVTFSWSPGIGATGYRLDVGTTGPGGANIFSRNTGSANLQVVSALPFSGATVYVRLWTLLPSGWQYVDYTYLAASPPPTAQMLTPLPGTKLTGSTATFTWNTGVGAIMYHLYVGTLGVGSTDVFSLNTGAARSQTVATLPVNGATLYVRLWSLLPYGWDYVDYVYTAAFLPPMAQMITPAPGTQLSGPNVTFTWSAAATATMYHLYVGTAGVGSTNIFSLNTGMGRSQVVGNLPLSGTTIYVRLWSLLPYGWDYLDYTYQAAVASTPIMAAMIAPVPGSALSGSSVTFTWDTGVGASMYHLYVGTAGAGSTNIFSLNTGTTRSQTVGNLPLSGTTVYVRLWSWLPAGWQYVDYTYSAAITSKPIPAAMLTPSPGNRLSTSSVTFTWDTGVGASMYHLYVGTTGAGSTNIFSLNTGTTRSQTVTNIPVGSNPIYVRLWTLLPYGWQFVDYVY